MLVAALRPHCGREREDTQENTGRDGTTEMLVIGGSESPVEVRGLAEYPSHGGSQGFKSPHLHPTTALVTGLAGLFRRAAAVQGRLPANGQQPPVRVPGTVGPATGRYGAFGAALGAALLAGKMLPPRVVSELYHATSATWTEQPAGPALLPFVRSAMNTCEPRRASSRRQPSRRCHTTRPPSSQPVTALEFDVRSPCARASLPQRTDFAAPMSRGRLTSP
jgi:hypothetical protein